MLTEWSTLNFHRLVLSKFRIRYAIRWMQSCFVEEYWGRILLMKATTISTSSQRGPLSRRIGLLKRECARLEEEVLQLKAAVHIWTEACRHTMDPVGGTLPKSLDAEIR